MLPLTESALHKTRALWSFWQQHIFYASHIILDASHIINISELQPIALRLHRYVAQNEVVPLGDELLELLRWDSMIGVVVKKLKHDVRDVDLALSGIGVDAVLPAALPLADVTVAVPIVLGKELLDEFWSESDRQEKSKNQ